MKTVAAFSLSGGDEVILHAGGPDHLIFNRQTSHRQICAFVQPLRSSGRIVGESAAILRASPLALLRSLAESVVGAGILGEVVLQLVRQQAIPMRMMRRIGRKISGAILSVEQKWRASCT